MKTIEKLGLEVGSQSAPIGTPVTKSNSFIESMRSRKIGRGYRTVPFHSLAPFFTARFFAARFHIQAIPTMILVRGGREVARQSGAMPVGALRAWIDRHLAA